MPRTKQTEAQIRDHLASRISGLPALVTNLKEVEGDHKARLDAFFAISADQGGPTAADLVRRILTKRNLRGLSSMYALEIVDTEFVVLSTGQPGFQPRIDILARCVEDSRFFLFEVKRLVETERQAVTELAAYTHGLGRRFLNLNTSDYVWVPICQDWRTTVRAAFANEAIWQHRAVLPMRYFLTKRRGAGIASVELELLSLLDDVDESLALSQFAWDCFDTLEFSLNKQPSDSRTVVEFVSAGGVPLDVENRERRPSGS